MKKERPPRGGKLLVTGPDAQLLNAYRQLPVAEQRRVFHQVVQAHEALDGTAVLEDILHDRVVRAEAQRLARAVRLRVDEFAAVVHPFRYGSYIARSPVCNLAKIHLTAGPRLRVTLIVYAAHDVHWSHTLVPEEFRLQVLAGEVAVERRGSKTRGHEGQVIVAPPGAVVRVRIPEGACVAYSEHPLTAWIRAHARP
jgi:quercetin dioxygenase-like cupin family protein